VMFEPAAQVISDKITSLSEIGYNHCRLTYAT
jgi:hypothetical protein